MNTLVGEGIVRVDEQNTRCWRGDRHGVERMQIN